MKMFMKNSLSTAEVFKSLGVPTVTYVDRENGYFEQLLSFSILAEGTLCLLTGPSKTGKTTLYKKVLNNLKRKELLVRCNDQMSTEQFWKAALEKIDFNRITAKKNSKKATTKIGTNLGWKWLLTELNLAISGELSEEKSREYVLAEPSPDHLIPILESSDYQLVIEDFHYLIPSVQKSISQQWKVFIDNEISVMVIGTSQRFSDLSLVNHDLIGRVNHIELRRWKNRDLKEIVERGLEYLKVEFPKDIINLIVNEAGGLPIMVQQICFQIFAKRGMYQRVDSDEFNRNLLGKPEVYEAMFSLANEKYSFYRDNYEILSKGIRSGNYNTYEKIILAFTIDPIKFELSQKEINKRIKFFYIDQEDQIPSELKIVETLENINVIQSENKIHVLDWVGRLRKLFVLQPTFIFYIRWHDFELPNDKLKNIFKGISDKIIKTSNSESTDISLSQSEIEIINELKIARYEIEK